MSNDNAETGCNTDGVATTDKQTVEKRVDDVPASAATPTVRPWTADFLLPSISFCEPKRP
jgi:hypothetical protein